MNISGTLSSGYTRVSSLTTQAKNAITEQGNKFSGSTLGQALKKVANVPINFVKSHPKLIAGVGIATTAIGGLTANPAAIGIGLALTSVGMMGYISSKHAEAKPKEPDSANAQALGAESEENSYRAEEDILKGVDLYPFERSESLFGNPVKNKSYLLGDVKA